MNSFYQEVRRPAALSVLLEVYVIYNLFPGGKKPEEATQIEARRAVFHFRRVKARPTRNLLSKTPPFPGKKRTFSAARVRGIQARPPLAKGNSEET